MNSRKSVEKKNKRYEGVCGLQEHQRTGREQMPANENTGRVVKKILREEVKMGKRMMGGRN